MNEVKKTPTPTVYLLQDNPNDPVPTERTKRLEWIDQFELFINALAIRYIFLERCVGSLGTQEDLERISSLEYSLTLRRFKANWLKRNWDLQLTMRYGGTAKQRQGMRGS